MSRFPLGRTLATPGARDAATPWELPALLQRHAAGDWGELDAEDRRANETALRIGERLLSAYTVQSSGARLWLITESDRSLTTILRPEDY